jgi:hypothetical protein
MVKRMTQSYLSIHNARNTFDSTFFLSVSLLSFCRHMSRPPGVAYLHGRSTLEHRRVRARTNRSPAVTFDAVICTTLAQ